jgi:hypothetical protein
VDYARRELIVNRVLSGRVLLRARGRRFFWCQPKRPTRYLAQVVYEKAFEEAKRIGLYPQEGGVEEFLLTRGLWTEEDGRRLTVFPNDIERLKEALYEARLKSDTLRELRGHLVKARSQWEALLSRRHAHDGLTCHGYASLTRGRYLVGAGLRTLSGKRVFRHGGFWKDRSGLLEEAVSAYAAAKLPDDALRGVARTDPWRGVWQAGKHEGGVFGLAAADLTDEQRALAGWSALYDSVREHPECPPEDVLSDNDMLDGWLSLQRKKARDGALRKDAEKMITNEKVRNAKEVFLVAETPADARRVETLNDKGAKAVKKQKLDYLARKGTVNDLDMPDTVAEIRLGIARLSADR